MSERRIVLRRPATASGATSKTSQTPTIPFCAPPASSLFVFVGGGYAAISTAVQLQRHMRTHQSEARIVMFSPEEFCSKPSVFFRLKFPDKERIEYGRVDGAYYQKHGIEMRSECVSSIDRDRQIVVTALGEQLHYHKLIIATGGRPQIPTFSFSFDSIYIPSTDYSALQRVSPFVDKVLHRAAESWNFLKGEESLPFLEVCSKIPQGIFPVRNPEESILLHQLVKMQKRILIVGGGTLCLDILNSMWEGKLLQKSQDIGNSSHISVIFRRKTLGFPLLDETASEIMTKVISEVSSVELLSEDAIDQVQLSSGEDPCVVGVKTKRGRELPCDAIVLATGVESDIDLARASGIDTNRGILVNKRHQTSDPHIFAVGDCAEIEDPLRRLAGLDARTIFKNWNSAAEQGKACASALITDDSYSPEVSAFFQSFRCFGFQVSIAGVSDSENLSRSELVDVNMQSARHPLNPSMLPELNPASLWSEATVETPDVAISGYIRIASHPIPGEHMQHRLVGVLSLTTDNKVGVSLQKVFHSNSNVVNVPMEELLAPGFAWDSLVRPEKKAA
eukprot:TRINITY_DN8779_c0_g1_i1.p1 TRINITY_DN8779_c0_g1~~TRINITY_DN8779_c0_g1_i1.p1  ORF type:complete len:563 (+),score=117.86 TRINITY_DN8779_c0_g1_i1:63-1751(+)